jgi:hypothetical protein
MQCSHKKSSLWDGQLIIIRSKGVNTRQIIWDRDINNSNIWDSELGEVLYTREQKVLEVKRFNEKAHAERISYALTVDKKTKKIKAKRKTQNIKGNRDSLEDWQTYVHNLEVMYRRCFNYRHNFVLND